MGYQTMADLDSLSGDNLRFWEGDTSASTSSVDFDTWNQAKITVVDSALSGIITVSASVLVTATMLFSF